MQRWVEPAGRRGLLIALTAALMLAILGVVPGASTAASAVPSCPSGTRVEVSGSTGTVIIYRCVIVPGSGGGTHPYTVDYTRLRWNNYCGQNMRDRHSIVWVANDTSQWTPGSTVTVTLLRAGVVDDLIRADTEEHFYQYILSPGLGYDTVTPYDVYQVTCNQGLGITMAYEYWVGDGQPPDATIPPEFIRDGLAAQIVVPGAALATSPPLDVRHTVAQVKTWLAVEDTGAFVASSGGIDVTATPILVTWGFDARGPDGAAMAPCAYPGSIWYTGRPDTAGDCARTFRHSTAGRGADSTNGLSVVATYEFTWSLGGVPQGGGFWPDLVSPPLVVDFQVGEIQAVGS